MRQDIEIDADSGDIASLKKPPAYSVNLTWVDEDDFYVYGECELKSYLSFDNLVGGIGVYVEQRDTIKEIKIKFSITDTHGEISTTGYMNVHSLKDVVMTGAKLPAISEDLYFRVYLFDGATNFTIASGYQLDCNVEASKDQNEYFLLITDRGSLYKSPLTGVGIRTYLNGDIASSNLPAQIQSEFALDGMTVSSIQHDSSTNEIFIESTEDN